MAEFRGSKGLLPSAYWVMSKSPRVTFTPKRIADGNWQIEASVPGAEIRIINGLTSNEDAREWIDGNRKIAWLRSQGYAK